LQLSCILKYSLIHLITLLFLTLSSAGQVACNLSVRGRVYDESKNPLPGATVYITELNIGEVTDQNGSYTFSGLCSGNYIFEIKFLGYHTQQIKIDLKRSENLESIMNVMDQLLTEVVISDHQDPVGKATNYGALSGKSLEEVRGKSLGESLQNVTGVNTIQSGPAIFKPVIHGVHSQRILILNNGIRQEGQQWGAEHAPEIDPFIASNIVVIKDAGAIKYGTDALGGVVIITPGELPIDQPLGGQVHVVGSSNGKSGIASGMLEGGVKDRKGWGWRVQGTAKKSGDMHTPEYNLSNTGFQELNYSASTGFHKDEKGFEVFYSHFNTTIGILRGSVVGSTEDLALALEQEPPQNTQPFTYQINQPRQEVKHDLLKLTSHMQKEKNNYRFQYGLQINNRLEFDVRRGSLNEVPALGYKLFTHTLDVEWEITRNPSHKSSYGINGMIQDNNKIDGTQTLPFIPNFNNYAAGLFWVEMFSKPKWDWEMGARYDLRYYKVVGFDFRNQLYRSKFNFNNVSATAAGTLKINEKSSFTTSLGSAWRPPNVAELYSLGTHQSAAAIEYGLLLDEITNEVRSPDDIDFQAEQAIKWVSTYRKQKQKWNVEISGYVNYIFNYIYLKPRGVTENTRGIFPYFRYTQTDASFLGADFSLLYFLTSKLKINTRMSLLRAKDETNHDYLIFIPSNRFDISLRYDAPSLKSFNSPYLEVRLKYVAKQQRAPRVVPIRDIIEAKEQGIDLFESDNRNFDFVDSPAGYFLMAVSAGISKPIKDTRLDFRISIENLANQSYREYSNRMRYYADEIGRNITISCKYSF
jgi:iron complex outermembrane recepter protein